MTISTSSSINYLTINENFPVAGQDNDTQVFRDNFDTIKTSLSAAKTEVDELLGAVARVDREENDFSLNGISNVILLNSRTRTNDARVSPITVSGSTIDLPIDALSGGYQIYTAGGDITIGFADFAGDPGNSTETDLQKASVSKVTLELYSDLIGAAEYTITFSLSGTGATQFKKSGWPDSSNTITLTSDSADNPIIIEFWRHDITTIYARYLGEFA